MKKILSIFAALLIAFAAYATIDTIPSGNPGGGTNLLKAALAGSADTIVMKAGTYFEDKSSHGGYIQLKRNVVIMAAEGAEVILQPEAYIQVRNGAVVKIQGIKFDGGEQDSYDYFIRFYDESSSGLVLESCEFYDVEKPVIQGKEKSHTDSLIVNNCYFHNNKQQAIVFAKSENESKKQTCDKLVVTNSTFANTDSLTNWISIIDIRTYGNVVTDTIEVVVDHCTFYNNPAVDAGHANIRPYKISNVTVSNCIFAHPQPLDQCATYCSTSGGLITNCLAYNYTHNATDNYAHAWGATVTNCMVANPRFTDVANGYQVEYYSSARGAATDGSDLGDPRWYTPVVYPNVDFASPYTCEAMKAKIIASERVSLLDDDTLAFKNTSSIHGTATWGIHATKAGRISATINFAPVQPNGHKCKVEILDMDDNIIGEAMAEPSQVTTGSDVLLPGSVYIPNAGDYKVKLTNMTNYSEAKVLGVTLSAATSNIFIAGNMNSWSTTANELEEVEENLYKVSFNLKGNQDFKIIDDGWKGYNDIGVNTTLSTETIYSVGENANYGFTLPNYQNIPVSIYWDKTGAETKIYAIADLTTVTANVVGNTTLGLDGAPATEGNDMTYNGDGTFSLVKNGVFLVASTNYWYKVTLFHDWTDSYGDPDNGSDYNNKYVNVAQAGTYNITFNFDWKTKAVSADVTLVSAFANGYYLIGNINGVSGTWTIADLTPERLLTQNPGNTDEYMIDVTLAANDEFQVVRVDNYAIGNWYPGGEGRNYIVDAFHAGEKTIYFRPDTINHAGEYEYGWHCKCLYVDLNDYVRSAVANKWGTICLPYKATLSNAKAYEIQNVDLGGKTITVEEHEGTLNAGGTYLVKAIDDGNITASLSGPRVYSPYENNGLYGNLEATPATILATDASYDYYILSENAFHHLEGTASATVAQYKGYLRFAKGNPAPALRIVEAENQATSIEGLNANETATKFIQNGKLYILRDGVVYDAMGKMVK